MSQIAAPGHVSSTSSRRPNRAVRPIIATLALSVLAVGLPPATAGASSANPQSYVTRPDLKPPGVRVLTNTDKAAPGYNFVGPKRGPNGAQAGNMIFDNAGELVYFNSTKATQMDFRPQTYQGKPVLTWWEGKGLRGYGFGKGVIVDQSYQQIATVSAGNGVEADFHEFKLTDRGTALLLGYKPIKRDLRDVGGSKNGMLMEGIVQEVDVASGKVLFDWRATKHVTLEEAYHPVPARRQVPYDFFHVNSVNLDTDGNYLVSARSTHTIYKLDRKSGRIIWRLGGKKPTFKHDKGTRTRWQHDVQRLPNGNLSIFDNNAHQAQTKLVARGLEIKVDEKAKRVRLVREFKRSQKVYSPNQGNMAQTGNGNFLISWGGTIPFLTEFSADGKVVWEARFSRQPTETYRAYRGAWTGLPLNTPKIAVRREATSTAVRVSWNGATTVAAYRVLVGTDPNALVPQVEHARTGFETLIPVAGHYEHVAVEALDAAGNVLRRSPVVAANAAEYKLG